MPDQTTDRLYTRFALLAPILVVIFLVLASIACGGPDANALCQARANRVRVMDAWRVTETGACQVAFKTMDGSLGDWLPIEPFEQAIATLAVSATQTVAAKSASK